MKDYIEIGDQRYRVVYRVVYVPDFRDKPSPEMMPVLEEIPFNSYSDDEQE